MKIREVRTLKITMSEHDFETIMGALAIANDYAGIPLANAAKEMRQALGEAVVSLRGDDNMHSSAVDMNAGNAANAGYDGTKLGKR